jgi:hypothetical protein
MSATIADGVLAATHKLVQQAMTGQWQEVPKTVEERRVLLDRLSASASPADHSWLSALKQAMAESDAAVARMATVEGTSDWGLGASQKPSADAVDEVANVMDMIKGVR